jgi:hypothetical protein
MNKSEKLSANRLDCIESLALFFEFDAKTPELAPRQITNKQLVEWEAACTNPDGFRQTSQRLSSHINKSLELNAKGPRGTVLKYPQWMREYTLSRGVFDLSRILADYNKSIAAKTPAK